MSNPDPGRRSLGRYEISAELERGGMAVFYRVLKPVNGHYLACKQLMAAGDARVFAEWCTRFEREFHTLSELSQARHAVDDVQRIDEPSAAFLAQCAAELVDRRS